MEQIKIIKEALELCLQLSRSSFPADFDGNSERKLKKGCKNKVNKALTALSQLEQTTDNKVMGEPNKCEHIAVISGKGRFCGKCDVPMGEQGLIKEIESLNQIATKAKTNPYDATMWDVKLSNERFRMLEIINQLLPTKLPEGE